MLISPHPYQKEAVPIVVKKLQGPTQRALVVMATGLGKTITAALIAQELKPRRLLFLVHNNFILDHAVGEFRKVYDSPSVTVINGLSKKSRPNSDMVFATWQTMGKIKRRWPPNYFDLIIVDEAHHAEAETYRPILAYFTGPKLGITATPDREDSLDVRKIFGPETVDISLEEAIARGWLPRVEYHVVTDESLDEDALQEIMLEIQAGKKRFTMAEVNRRIFIRKRDEEIAKIIDGYDEKSIVFCANIAHAERMSKSLESGAAFHSKVGNGQFDTWEKNQRVLEDLRLGAIDRVCAVNAFNEGVDVPIVGLVAFCRVTSSLTIFRQQLGRGLRPGKDKLIVLDFVGNLERIQLVLVIMDRISTLHKRYVSEEDGDLEGHTRRQRFEVSGKGFEFTFSDTVVDLIEVLNHVERDFYPTWREASRAAIRLGLNKMDEYYKQYRLDSRLPSTPAATYSDYPGDSTFFGRKEKKFYETWSEASKGVIRLGIHNMMTYIVEYKKDAKLPSNPSKFYPDYPGDELFFGRRKKILYKTWRRASSAARKLKITSASEYEKKRKKDPKLPSVPYLKYKNFPGWDRFLGRKNNGGQRRKKKGSPMRRALLLYNYHMTRQEFEKIVEEEFPRAVPEKFHGLITNVGFLIEEEPDQETRREYGLSKDETLLGLYKGISHVNRGEWYGVGATLPDTITLYKRPIEEEAHVTGHTVAQVVRETIWHEVAHYFGYDEDQVGDREQREGLR